MSGFCEQCGAALGEGARFCATCGAEVEPTATPEVVSSAEKTASEVPSSEETAPSELTGELSAYLPPPREPVASSGAATPPQSGESERKSRKRLYLIAAVVVLAIVIGVIAAATTGSNKPQETFKQAQAAMVKPYTNLLSIVAQSASTGADMTAQEEKATGRLIAAVHEHRPALGLREAKRSLTVTAYTLKVGGDVCPTCQQELNAAAAELK